MTRRLKRLVLTGSSLLVFLAPTHAANIRWGTGNGTFHTAANWTGGIVPGVIDVAQFGRSVQFIPQTYTVSFNNNATNQSLHIEDDQVTFDLNSRVYTVTAADGVLIGLPGNFAGRLTVLDGTLSSSTKIDVGAAANRAGFLTVGAGGLVSGAANLNVGNLATGTLNVQAGGGISLTGATTVGVGNGITGTANIVGDGTIGSATLLTGGLNVGSTGNGTVNVQLGGLLQNSGTASIGGGDLFTGVGAGIVNVMNPGSVWNSQGLLEVGDAGSGEVNVTLGGKLTSIDTIVGADVSNSGEVNVEGPNSLWDNSGTLTIGSLGNGTLNITNQGSVETSEAVVGSANFPSSNGTVSVTGAGSSWLLSLLTVGQQGTGTLAITDGGTVSRNSSSLSVIVGAADNSTGIATVDGLGSVLDNATLTVGLSGQGTLNVTNGGNVSTSIDAILGTNFGSSGNVMVSDVGSLWDCSGVIVVGFSGNGDMQVLDGAKAKSKRTTIGLSELGEGQITVDGVGSMWEYSDSQQSGQDIVALTIGDEGFGTLEITGGGQVISTSTSDLVINEIGAQAGSTGLVRVSGEGSLWEAGGGNSGHITVGKAGNGTLEITGGSVVRADELKMGEELGSNGIVTVDTGSRLELTGELQVGEFGRGELTISGGGHVQSGGFFESISGPINTPSVVMVHGSDSRWESSTKLFVGNNFFLGIRGAGSLIVSGGGRVTTGGDANVGAALQATGTATISGVGSIWEIGGDLKVGAEVAGVNNNGVGTVHIQSGASVTVQRIDVFRDSFFSLEGGTLSADSINFSDFAEASSHFEWTAGTLQLNFFDGDLINQAGTFAPGNADSSFGSAQIFGNYNQLADATLQFEIGGSTLRDSLGIVNNAFINGQLEIVLMNDFIPQQSDSFIIVGVQNNLFGTFANVANGQRLPTSDGLGSFVVEYVPGNVFNHQIVLSNFLATSLPGDFDNDGDVDGRDFLVWQRNPSVGDLADWQANYGVEPLTAASVPVPEPRVVMFLPVGLLMLGRRPAREGQRAEC